MVRSTVFRILFSIVVLLSLASCGQPTKTERASAQAGEDGFEVLVILDGKPALVPIDKGVETLLANSGSFAIEQNQVEAIVSQLNAEGNTTSVEVTKVSDDARKFILSVDKRNGDSKKFTYFVRSDRISPMFFLNSDGNGAVEYFYQ